MLRQAQAVLQPPAEISVFLGEENPLPAGTQDRGEGPAQGLGKPRGRILLTAGGQSAAVPGDVPLRKDLRPHEGQGQDSQPEQNGQPEQNTQSEQGQENPNMPGQSGNYGQEDGNGYNDQSGNGQGYFNPFQQFGFPFGN